MTNSDAHQHITVLQSEAIDQLQPQAGRWYIDATFGSGGHTAELIGRGARVIALDFDQAAITAGEKAFAEAIAAGTLKLVRANFDQLTQTVRDLQRTSAAGSISGCIFDLGTSTNQLMSSERGFSFRGEGTLDMRMDDRLGVQAKDLLAVLPFKQLAPVLRDLGGEVQAVAIAKAIVKEREQGRPVTTAHHLSSVVERIKGPQRGKLHPATKVFQALRIAVNDELDNLTRALPQALESIEPGGIIVTISFHEGEDRIVKHAFRQWHQEHKGEMIGPLEPSESELLKNPRARSAKLRVFHKEL